MNSDVRTLLYFIRRRQDIQEGRNGEPRPEVENEEVGDPQREAGGYEEVGPLNINNPQPAAGGYEEVGPLNINNPQPAAGGYEVVGPLNIHNPQPAAGGYEEVGLLDINNPQPAAGGYEVVGPLDINNPQPAAGGYEVVPAASLQPQATNDNTQSGIQQRGNQNDVQNLTYSNNFTDQREENGQQLAGGTEEISAPKKFIPQKVNNKTLENRNRQTLNQLLNNVGETCETYENRFLEDTGSQHLEGVDNINQGDNSGVHDNQMFMSSSCPQTSLRREAEENDDDEGECSTSAETGAFSVRMSQKRKPHK